jgi:hypothetical protein
MNKSLGFELIVYSVLLAGLGYLAYHLAPTVARPTLITGLIGGALCLVWGLRAVLGKCGKALPVLTLIPVSYVMLGQVIMTWGHRNESGSTNNAVLVLIIIIFAFSLAMLLLIAYHGSLYGLPPGPVKEQPVKSPASNKLESDPRVSRRL